MPKVIPTLTPEQLIQALADIDALQIDKASKDTLRNMLIAASNPNSQLPQEQAKLLPAARRALVTETALQVQSLTTAVTTRGRRMLMQVSAAEWDQLVKDAEGE